MHSNISVVMFGMSKKYVHIEAYFAPIIPKYASFIDFPSFGAVDHSSEVKVHSTPHPFYGTIAPE